jgi:hypothetical protein
MIFTTITIDVKKIDEINKTFIDFKEKSKILPFKLARILVKYLKRQLMMQQKKAPRSQLASKIRAVRTSQRTSVIKMPQKLVYLDSMKPHYVSLKRGRQITRWARKYYDGSYGKTGRSRVRRGPRGGVYGFLYVTPDPFVARALQNAAREYNDYTRNFLRKITRR